MGLIQFLRRNPVKIAHWSEAKSACRIVGRLGQELPQEPKPIKESPKSHIILDTIIGYIMRTILTKNLHQGFTQTRTRMFSRTAFPTADFSEHHMFFACLCLSPTHGSLEASRHVPPEKLGGCVRRNSRLGASRVVLGVTKANTQFVYVQNR
jgi:hypothetical protein